MLLARERLFVVLRPWIRSDRAKRAPRMTARMKKIARRSRERRAADGGSTLILAADRVNASGASPRASASSPLAVARIVDRRRPGGSRLSDPTAQSPLQTALRRPSARIRAPRRPWVPARCTWSRASGAACTRHCERRATRAAKMEVPVSATLRRAVPSPFSRLGETNPAPWTTAVAGVA